jgi:hypothetical protein
MTTPERLAEIREQAEYGSVVLDADELLALLALLDRLEGEHVAAMERLRTLLVTEWQRLVAEQEARAEKAEAAVQRVRIVADHLDDEAVDWVIGGDEIAQRIRRALDTEGGQ